jgi:oxygen-dependent protoporphyrinogen oxidase
MSSDHVDGLVLDRGAYTLSSYATRTLALAKETGCDGLIAPISPWAGYVRKRRVRRYRSDSMPGMALGVGLSPTDMVSALLMLRESDREAAHLRLHKPDERTFELEEETAADYALRLGGDGLLERVAYPLISALYLSDPEHISKAALLATIRYVKGLALFNSPRGIGFLAEELARGSRVRLRTEVRSLALHGDGVRAVLHRDGKDETVTARAAVCTAAAPDALAAIPEVGEALSSALAEVAYTPSVPVALVLDRRIEEKAFSVSLSRERFKHLALFTHEHNKCAGRVPEGRGLIMAYPGVDASRAFMDLDDGDVVQAVLEDLHRVYPALSDSVESTVVYRWRNACSQLRPGDLRRRAGLRAALPTEGPLVFAGDYLSSSSSIEGSLAGGIAAAGEVARRLATGTL